MKTDEPHLWQDTGRLLVEESDWHPCFDAISETILVIDSNFEVLQANRAATAFFAAKREKIVGRPCFRLVHSMEAPPENCPHLRAMATGNPQAAEIEDPELGRTLSISVFPVKDDQGRVVRVVEVINDVTLRREEEEQSIRLTEALANSFSGITEAISGLAERRDPYTAGHSKGVAVLAVDIARQMGMEEKDIRGLKVCAILHDIGKITISSGILNKSGRLSENEWGIIRMHPRTAYEALCRIDFPWPVAEVVYQHQERMDGSGYPRGLKGDEVHPWARIVAVADVVDAMITHRPYRPAFSKRDAINELKRGRSREYDGEVVDTAIRLLTKKSRRILVVEDEPAVLELILELLGDADPDLEVQGFTEPLEALEAFEKQPFPVIVTDVNMPGMNGLELLRRVREIHPATRAIIFTGLGEKHYAVEALRLGAADFLEKPFGIHLLKSSVETTLRRYEEEQ
jgi:putative nucleotidyltransferase with HDIG domain/PAS domain S-box-containing protein